MYQIRTILSVSLLWLLCTALVGAVEVLPMDNTEPGCASVDTSVAEPQADAGQEHLEVVVEAAEAPAGLQAVGAGAPPIRTHGQGGGDSSTPPAAKPSSRWNAFLPGMVR